MENEHDGLFGDEYEHDAEKVSAARPDYKHRPRGRAGGANAPSGGRKARTRASPEQELSRIRRQATTEETRFDHGTSRIHGGSKTRDEAEPPEEKGPREQVRTGRSKQKTLSKQKEASESDSKKGANIDHNPKARGKRRG